jgi:hypothetical protein
MFAARARTDRSISVSSRMSGIERRHDGERIILPVAILPPPEPSELRWVEAPALIDTGATTRGIAGGHRERSRPAADRQAPDGIGVRRDLVDRFLFRIGVFADREQDDDRPAPPFLFDEVEGFCRRDGFQFRVIIGMDVLSQCDLTIDRKRRYSLRFGHG